LSHRSELSDRVSEGTAMSFENKLHAVLLVAFVALVCAAFVTVAPYDTAQRAALAKAKTTQVASATAAPSAAR